MNCDKCPTLVRVVDNGGGCGWVGQGLYENSLYLLLNFAVNLKLLRKTRSLKNNNKIINKLIK